MRLSLFIIPLILLVLGVVVSAAPISAKPESDALAERALVSASDTARLQHVLAKALRGESVTIGVIGGSITQGAKASEPEKRYANLVTAWWRQTFPKAKIELVNAGVGATGSYYGALRVSRDLLAQHPDFVMVDFAVNDAASSACTETMEGLVRQILKQPNAPAVLLLFMMKEDGTNAQPWQAQVGAHYALPMVSYRNAMWPEIHSGRLAWKEISPDDIHPNDRGMALVSDFVTHFLEQTLHTLPAEASIPAAKAIPTPLVSDRFEHVALSEGGALQPVTNSGWSYDKTEKAWTAKRPGSVIEFASAGQSLSLIYYRLRGAMGRAKVEVDGASPVTLDGWFPGTWGGYRDTVSIADKITSGNHTVRIELLAEHDSESTGTEFRILGLGAAGVSVR